MPPAPARKRTSLVSARICLERLHLVTLAGAAGQVQQTTRLTTEQRDILAELQIEPPPRLTSLTPA